MPLRFDVSFFLAFFCHLRYTTYIAIESFNRKEKGVWIRKNKTIIRILKK